MKQKDLTLIIVIAFISAVVSFVVSTRLFVTPANRQQKVPTVDAIDSSFVKPSSKYFNAQSVNPAQQVQISNNANQNPFSTTTGQ
jgi:hypothetical protein